MSNILSRVFRNNITAVLTAGINSSATSLSVQTGQGAGFALETGQHIRATLTQGSTIEIVNVTARSGDTLTIQRGKEGTTPAAFTAGASISIRWTADTINEIVSILSMLDLVLPGSVWVDGLWGHQLIGTAPFRHSVVTVDTLDPAYVAGAFELAVGDYIEVTSDRQIVTNTVGQLWLGFNQAGQSYGISDFFEETQSGADWIYKYVINVNDIPSGFTTTFLENVNSAGLYMPGQGPSGESMYIIKDIVTSRGSLQPGALAASQQMTTPSKIQ